MEILEQKENSLLNRTEIRIIVEAEKNPSMQDALKIIAEKFKAAEDLISIKGIGGKFGRGTFLISANIYKNKEDKDILEKKKEKKTAGGK